MFTKEELFYIIDCLDQDYYNIKDIEDLELQRHELSKNARICSILSDLIDVETAKEEKIEKARAKQPQAEW
tara:strand:+ start:91 stop:303 length:213 start_codon:yes stop_codon:yes gene_type:complete